MNAILINLFLAVFWIFLGGALLAHELVTERRMFKLPLGGINPGWVAILLGAYNCYRVYWIWSHQSRRRQDFDEDNALRRQWDRERRREPSIKEPPNPDFMFDQPKSSENIQKPTSEPPPQDAR